MTTHTSMMHGYGVHLPSFTKEGLLRRPRYLIAIALAGALYAGLYFYAEFIKTPPACALENHHRAGNCPVQVLRWYPRNAIENWYTNKQRLKWPASLNAPGFASDGDDADQKPPP